MKPNYDLVLDFILRSGKLLVHRSGKIKDIGVKKQFLTEEDLKIERGLQRIVSKFGKTHRIYAEEENDLLKKSKNIWVIDPISATHQFIYGKNHFAIVVCHLQNKEPKFAAVYDPTVNELYTAFKGKGAFLNGKPIQVSKQNKTFLLRISGAWDKPRMIKKVLKVLKNRKIKNNSFSLGVNYCWVAKGKFDAIVSFTKDSFPEFAGHLIVEEAGGMFTNISGEKNIKSTDRIFVGGNEKAYKHFFALIRKAVL